MRETIADIAAAVIKERGDYAIMSGDIGLLDDIAIRADKEIGTKLARWTGKGSPDRYHTRILDALQTKRGQQLFVKAYLRHEGCRLFKLREKGKGMSFNFRVGQMVKFITRSYGQHHETGAEEGDDYYAKTRIQGSGTIIDLTAVPASAGARDKSFIRLKVEIRKGFTIDLDVTNAEDKTTFIQPLD